MPTLKSDKGQFLAVDSAGDEPKVFFTEKKKGEHTHWAFEITQRFTPRTSVSEGKAMAGASSALDTQGRIDMTAQVPDVLEFEGKRRFLYTNPLDALPRDRVPAFIANNSANWRGYIAHWEIKDGKLTFLDIAAEACRLPAEEECPRAYCGRRHPGDCMRVQVEPKDIFDTPPRSRPNGSPASSPCPRASSSNMFTWATRRATKAT